MPVNATAGTVNAERRFGMNSGAMLPATLEMERGFQPGRLLVRQSTVAGRQGA
jgi:hypothetical protein